MAKKTEQVVPEIIDSVEGLNAKMAAMREAQKVFATTTQLSISTMHTRIQRPLVWLRRIRSTV